MSFMLLTSLAKMCDVEKIEFENTLARKAVRIMERGWQL